MFSYTLKNKTAFTLAEVLITLGIIGIVAALTLPALNQHYKRQEVETRLQKFYSTMNQALKQSELDNGDFTTWEYNIKSNGRDNDTNVEWYNKYLAPYLKPLKVDIIVIIMFSYILQTAAWCFYAELELRTIIFQMQKIMKS